MNGSPSIVWGVSLAMIGVSHRDVSLTQLDALSRGAQGVSPSLVRTCSPRVSGAVLLSTCNRVELYLEGPDSTLAGEAAAVFLREHLGDDAPAEALHTVRHNKDVARHLFAVSVGLESMVVGEHEIAGQVRQAVSAARNEKTVSPALDRLFRGAALVSREIANSTNLGSAGRSLVSVALDLVERQMGPIAGRTALVIGTGAYARVIHAALKRRGVEDRLVFSVSGRAGEFAEAAGGTRVSQLELVEAIQRADIVLSSSGAPHTVLETDMLASATKDRSAPLAIVDLALSHDVEQSAAELPNLWLIDLDTVARHSPKEHTLALAVAYRTVEEAAEEFIANEFKRTADNAVVALRNFAESPVAEEIERVRRSRGDDAARIVHESVSRVIREILHTPTVRAQQLTREGRLDEVEHALQVLLGIDPRERGHRGTS